MKKLHLISALVFLGLFSGLAYGLNRRNFPSVVGGTFMEFETARIVEIVEDNRFEDDLGQIQGNVRLTLEFLSGRYRGEQAEATYFYFGLDPIDPSPGDRVSVRVSTMDGKLSSVAFDSFERRDLLFGAIAIFFVVLVLVGGAKGLMSILGLSFTLVSIIFVLIPLMLRGLPPIPTTLLFLGIVSMVTLVLLFGYTKKMWISLTGCLLGMLIAAALSGVAGWLLTINGYHMEEAFDLVRLVDIYGHTLQSRGLLVSGILIASLGAVMDTAVSVVSAMEEIANADPGIPMRALFQSGMNVGRDMMGTMSNTLILAFAGTGLNMMIITYMTSFGLNQLMNTDIIAIEIIRALSGSLGLILTIPIVALLSAYVLEKK